MRKNSECPAQRTKEKTTKKVSQGSVDPGVAWDTFFVAFSAAKLVDAYNLSAQLNGQRKNRQKRCPRVQWIQGWLGTPFLLLFSLPDGLGLVCCVLSSIVISRAVCFVVCHLYQLQSFFVTAMTISNCAQLITANNKPCHRVITL